MENKLLLILPILKKIFGDPKKDGDLKEYEFNCKSKACRNDVDKYNLAYNSKNNIFHCWKCKYSGTIHKIVEDYGIKDDLNKIELVLPKSTSKKPYTKKEQSFNDLITCSLPEGFSPLIKKSDSRHYKAALKYAMGSGPGERQLTWETIKKYNIGYTEDVGNRKYRIIFPSYNAYGQINYYVGRVYYEMVKPKYIAPPKEEVARTEIIFNVKNINFDIPVILVEGVFDMTPLYNAIPMLGKELCKLIIDKFKEHNTKVILCLDEDALYDSINIFNELTSYGLEVYFIEIKDDIDQFNRDNGKLATIELLKKTRDLEFQNIFKEFALKQKSKKPEDIDEVLLKKDWEEVKKQISKEQTLK